jgi:hypothetical protein
MPKIRTHFIFKLAIAIVNCALLAVTLSFSAGSLMAQASRVTALIDNSRRIALSGHVHPLARPEFD